MDASHIPGAVCANHPDQPLAFTCARCGAFACEQCRRPGDRCASCVRREGQVSIAVGAVLRESFSLVLRCWGRLALFASVQLVSGIGVGLFSAIYYEPHTRALTQQLSQHPDATGLADFYAGLLAPMGWLTLGSTLVGAFALACYVQVLGDGARETVRPPAAQLAAALRAYPATLFVMLVRGAATMLGTLVCCVPGMAVYVLFCMAAPAVGLGGNGFASLATSWRLAQRRVWPIAGAEAVGVGLLMGASIAAAGVSAGMKFFGLPGQVLGAMITASVTTAVTLPLYAIDVVLYLRAKALDAAAEAG